MRITLACLSLILFFLAGCERDTKVRLRNEQLPPSFELSGSGRLAMIRVHGQKVRDAPGEAAYIIWEITPKTGRFNGALVEDLRDITYGKVPEGYIQNYPHEGEALPPLIEEQRYHVFFDTVNANGANEYFEIQKGKVIEIQP